MDMCSAKSVLDTQKKPTFLPLVPWDGDDRNLKEDTKGARVAPNTKHRNWTCVTRSY